MKMKIDLAVKPHAVLIEGRADSDGGGGAEVIGIESDADTVIDRQDQLLVPLSPVLNDGDVGGRASSHHQQPVLRLARHGLGERIGDGIFQECEWENEGKGI